MTQELLSKYTPHIKTITLLPSSGGRFEVSVDGETIYSKKALGRHAQPGEIAALLEANYGFVSSLVEDDS